MFDDSKPEIKTGIVAPEMPLRNNDSPSKLQIFASNTFVNSLFKAVMEMRVLTFWARSTDIPSDFPI